MLAPIMGDLGERRGIETDVYQPAEDSHLLAEAIISDFVSRERADGSSAGYVLEVGTGSGVVAERLTEETGATVIGADLNPHASRQARARGVEAVRADLVSPFKPMVFEAVAFNPPYLPRDPEAERADWMEVALTGGETGREVIEQFLDDVGRVLTPDGCVYLLVSTLTGVDEVVEYAGDRGFSAVALRDESFPFETLTVLRLFR